MRDYIKKHHENREYENYVQLKVDKARKQRDEGLYFSNETVKTDVLNRREKLAQQEKD